jgi:DNA adenine methylase
MEVPALRSFIAWVGGKRQLARHIVSLIPEHRTYVEPFGGAGWVLFAKPREMSAAEIYNDVNEDLVNLFRIIQGRLAEFYCRQRFLITSRVEFADFLERRRRHTWLDDVERAVGFFYLLKSSFAAKGTIFFLERTRAPRYKPDQAFLEEIRDRLRGVVLECRSFEQLIKACDGPETFFYCDPPYTMCGGGHYYSHEFTGADHRRLAEMLKGVKGRWLLSYDDSPLVRDLYKGCRIEKTKPVAYSMNNQAGRPMKRAGELLIRNY